MLQNAKLYTEVYEVTVLLKFDLCPFTFLGEL